MSYGYDRNGNLTSRGGGFSWAPGQNITPGGFCYAEASFGIFGIPVGPVAVSGVVQAGKGDLTASESVTEGERFAELGAFVAFDPPGPGATGICGKVF